LGVLTAATVRLERSEPEWFDYGGQVTRMAGPTPRVRQSGETGHDEFVLTIRNPFNVLAEGLIVKKDRGDKTAIELLIAGVRS
jgi:hypothetical protein